MTKKLTFSVIALLVTPVIWWAMTDDSRAKEKPCTKEWFSLVEQQVLSGDASGHGPDLGSGEWRSVVEFKLGVRGNPGTPPRATDRWCEYIDTHFIQPHS